MNLTDLLPLEKWVAFEKAMIHRSGLDACVFDIDGIRISKNKQWVNKLCPVIKANPKGQTFICSVAHQNIATMAEKTRKPVIQECDAGLMKAVAPVFVGDKFLGVVGGCGGIFEGVEVESFLISKLTGIDEDEVLKLVQDIPVVSMEEIEEFVEYVRTELDGIVNDFKQNRGA